jgi:hypothetical protein
VIALLFLGAKDHRIGAGDLDDMRKQYVRLNVETSRNILKHYQSRKAAAAVESDQGCLDSILDDLCSWNFADIAILRMTFVGVS